MKIAFNLVWLKSYRFCQCINRNSEVTTFMRQRVTNVCVSWQMPFSEADLIAFSYLSVYLRSWLRAVSVPSLMTIKEGSVIIRKCSSAHNRKRSLCANLTLLPRAALFWSTLYVAFSNLFIREAQFGSWYSLQQTAWVSDCWRKPQYKWERSLQWLSSWGVSGHRWHHATPHHQELFLLPTEN